MTIEKKFTNNKLLDAISADVAELIRAIDIAQLATDAQLNAHPIFTRVSGREKRTNAAIAPLKAALTHDDQTKIFSSIGGDAKSLVG